MEDYRNNFKVEKTLKTSLIRDRARVQIGRISMFGLMELSRQRLRSSLIDRSFEKCPYCKGSGLLLNSSSISEQIIKVIKEKVTNNSGSSITVKCNTELAENLINIKKNEIINLETSFNSNIKFNFNNHYSLHDYDIELEENKNSDIENEKKDKKSKTKIKIKKKKTVKSKIKVKEKKFKGDKLENNENTDSKKDKTNFNEDNSEINEEKTGWWS